MDAPPPLPQAQVSLSANRMAQPRPSFAPASQHHETGTPRRSMNRFGMPGHSHNLQIRHSSAALFHSMIATSRLYPFKKQTFPSEPDSGPLTPSSNQSPWTHKAKQRGTVFPALHTSHTHDCPAPVQPGNRPARGRKMLARGPFGEGRGAGTGVVQTSVLRWARVAFGGAQPTPLLRGGHHARLGWCQGSAAPMSLFWLMSSAWTACLPKPPKPPQRSDRGPPGFIPSATLLRPAQEPRLHTLSLRFESSKHHAALRRGLSPWPGGSTVDISGLRTHWQGRAGGNAGSAAEGGISSASVPAQVDTSTDGHGL